MAEVKNAFIKSKMNKDLDDRLIPNGEYRDAQNVQISKSQGPDVGALESVYGNELTKNFASALKTPAATVDPNIKCIGNFVDDFNNIIYSFWTDNTGEILNGANATPNIPNGYLPVGAIGSLDIVTPGTGFSVGDELPSDLGFSSGGYNANVTVASVDGSGGVTGVNINFPGQLFSGDLGSNSSAITVGSASGLVLKLTGLLGNNFITSYSPQSGAFRVIATGNFLNFSQKNPIIGVNLLENLLFFTDNRNQPRKVNVTRGGSTPAQATYYTTEDQISVAKYNPYEPIRLYQLSALAAATATATGAASNVSTINLGATISGNIKVGQLVTGSGVLPNTFVSGFSSPNVTFNKQQNFSSTTLTFTSYETAMKDVISPNIPLATSGTTNPYLITNYTGDVDFLEDKFAKFSYRFRFDDGEYSIFAPFTQTTFIPKQDGYFINNDEQSAIESTVVQFMENKINYIQLNLPLPSSGATLVDTFKITEVDILYKESDSLAVQVIETLPVSKVVAGAASTNIFTYNYLGTKPFKTLPEDELIRVFDKIPVKAFSQELASNRVIYGNFQNKHTPPSGINYQVATNEKFEIQNLNSNKGVVAYPNSSLKENRNYQAGFVLSDRFGRQSSVLLSTNNSDTLTANLFGASTVFNPYQTPGSSITWRGDSLKIEVLSEITSGINGNDTTSSSDIKIANSETGEPGLYNTDTANYDYNPLGWYSYKIVVQQKEQEYYNVYLPGIVKGPLNTTGGTAFEELTGQTTLFNDNINKVPRDLSEVGPDQRQFRSSVQLFGRVQNTTAGGAYSTVGNEQYDPNISATDLVPQSITVNVISDLKDLFDVDGVIPLVSTPTTGAVNIFYDASSNPLIGRMISTKTGGIGTAQGAGQPYPEMNQLAILETEPVESRLDLFFETSTAGLISVLNPQINDNQGASNFNAWNYLQTEAMASASTIVNASTTAPYTGYFYPQTALGNQIPAYTISNFKVLKSGGSNITSRFTLTKSTIIVGNTATATSAASSTATITLSSISGTVKVDDLVTGTGVLANTFVLSIAGSTVVLNKVQTFSSTTLTFTPARDVLRLATNDVFYYAPGSSATENYTFSVDVTDINGITNTIVKTGNLTNIAPTITNCTTPVTIGAGDTTVKTFAAVNGAIAATGQQASDLVWSIQSQQQNGLDVTVFSINSSGLLTVSNGIGAYDVTVRVIDAGGTAGFLTADCTFVVNVGVPPVDSNFNQGIALEAFDGEYNLLAFVDSDTNVTFDSLLATPPVPKIYSFTGIVAGSGYTDTDDLATTVLPLGGTGLKVNQVLTGGAIQSLSVEEAGSGYSLNDIITVVEGANTTGGATINGIPFSASDPTVATNFFCTSPSNKYTQTGNIYVKNNLKGALTQGQFFVSMSVFNADVSSTVALPNIPVVQYRANSGATWINATDINGEASNLNGQWLGIKGGMTNNNGPGGGNNFEVTNSGSSNQTGTKIQVFGVGGSGNGAGEYRIIQPNLTGTNLQYPSCSGTVSSFTTMTTEVGDANYPQIGTGPLYYEYRISAVGATCSSSMPTTVYARERITKYVTQLYSNTSLTQVKTLTSGAYRFQRPSVNLEQNKDGAYTATFNASGLRTTASSPCVYT